MTYKERVSVGQGTSLDKLGRANNCTDTCSSKSCCRNNSIQWQLSPWLFFALSIPTCPPPSIHPPCIHDHHPCYCIIRPAFQPHNAISYERLTTMGEGRRALSCGWPRNLKSRIQMKHCNVMHPSCKCNFWLQLQPITMNVFQLIPVSDSVKRTPCQIMPTWSAAFACE
jgi:hypothetical protein